MVSGLRILMCLEQQDQRDLCQFCSEKVSLPEIGGVGTKTEVQNVFRFIYLFRYIYELPLGGETGSHFS